MRNTTYILITAAYNEEKNIEKTIQSVISQSMLPSEWILVSDGSIDNTDSIIQSYQKKYGFITYHRIPNENKHGFASKVFALQAGIDKIKSSSYEFIGTLDADVTFDKDYFKKIILKFEKNPKLGIAGGNVVELHRGKIFKRIKTFNSVAGAVQFFKKDCFEKTGDFLPLEYGGEDAAKEIIARMKGWEVKTFPDIEVVHHGFVGGRNPFRNRYRAGIQHCLLGYHPVFYLSRCIYRLKERPVIIGSVIELIGFCYAALKYKEKKVPPDVVQYLRSEQLRRLKGLFGF